MKRTGKGGLYCFGDTLSSGELELHKGIPSSTMLENACPECGAQLIKLTQSDYCGHCGYSKLVRFEPEALQTA